VVGESPGAASDAERPAPTLLGPLQVQVPDGPLHVTPGRQQVILAALLLRANQVVGTDHLVDPVWGDAPPKTARARVQICVSRLRTLLGRAARPATIPTRPSGYVLTTEPGNVDAVRFTGLVAGARRLGHEGRREEAVARLRRAAALWQGDCLSGLDPARGGAVPSSRPTRASGPRRRRRCPIIGRAPSTGRSRRRLRACTATARKAAGPDRT